MRYRPLTLAVSILVSAPTPKAQVPVAGRRDGIVAYADAADRVARAVKAVEGDSVDAVRRSWEREVAAHPDAPGPVQGPAALDRLTSHTAAAETAYARLIGDDRELTDPVARVAALGLGLTLAGAFRANEALVVLSSLRARSRGTAGALALLNRADSIMPPSPTRWRSHRWELR